MDCAGGKWGDYGCDGGLQHNAFYYWETNYPETEADYPYTGKDGTCSYDSSKTAGVKVNNYMFGLQENPDSMKSALEKQPISVSLEADQAVF